jgi:hypothetical protein
VIQNENYDITAVRRVIVGRECKSDDNYLCIDSSPEKNGLVNGTSIVISGEPILFEK